MIGAPLLRDTAVLALGLLLGSIPFGLLIGRAASGADVRRVGSGNIGATNVLRASGPGPAALTLLMDAAKGAGAVLLARGLTAGGGTALGEGRALEGWAALAAVAGHVFSPWLGFKGGKGVATAAGAMLVLSPALLAPGLAAFALTFAITRIVSLSSITAVAAACLLAALDRIAGWGIVPAALAPLAGIGAVVLVRHAANIGRILRGEEEPVTLRRTRGGRP